MTAAARSLPRRALAAGLDRLMRGALRGAFRRVEWAGPPPVLPEDAPVVIYANHHSFYDGYLFHVVLAEVLGRTGTIWMHDWDHYPFFAAAGAQPFPPDDPARRAATLRRTIRRMRRTPDLALILFPEGRLHPPDDGVLPFDDALVARLGRLLPAAAWCPVAVHVTWRGEARPTAILTAGTPHAEPDGGERARLETLLEALRCGAPLRARTLLEGRTGAPERFRFTALRGLCERLL